MNGYLNFKRFSVRLKCSDFIIWIFKIKAEKMNVKNLENSIFYRIKMVQLLVKRH